jgi:hypothetical protein
VYFFLAIAGKRVYIIYMTSKERMKSWEALDAEPKPSWETWKRILRMPHIGHDPKRAKEQWDKILENNARKNKKVLDSIIFKV